MEEDVATQAGILQNSEILHLRESGLSATICSHSWTQWQILLVAWQHETYSDYPIGWNIKAGQDNKFVMWIKGVMRHRRGENSPDCRGWYKSDIHLTSMSDKRNTFVTKQLLPCRNCALLMWLITAVCFFKTWCFKIDFYCFTFIISNTVSETTSHVLVMIISQRS